MSTAFKSISQEQWRGIVAAAPAVGEGVPISNRHETRWYLQSGTAELCYHNANNEVCKQLCLVQNVSDQGLMVRADLEIPENTFVIMSVDFENDNATLLGMVRHCSLSVGAYKLGIRLLFDDEAESCFAG